ncbi:MAG: ATP-binding protein [Cyclobacteriaceae bacterium]|jgi:serine/threonine-protein kinase RsbW|nr:ATP-binding protein [Flammeovirgaceae bacterium]MCZ8021056.1 ATP-binding protein [Cytophagales bacterium]MCZ8328539.1 ATP-binding protein [Cyclobacteriaceae bacterium]
MKYSFSIGCKLENLKDLRAFIRESLGKHGVTEVQVSEIVLALDEMCSNLMIHAHHCNPKDFLEINIVIAPGTPLIFEIIDDGTLFDINQFSEPELNNLIHDKRKGGLGIRLVKSIMDKIEYTHQSGRNICRLQKTVTLTS